MKGRRILSTRKRVIVALVHTAVFFAVAIKQIRMPPAQSLLLTAIYGVVAAVLAILTAKSGSRLERLYFGVCASSACLGLAGQIWGGAVLENAAYPRTILLACAVVTGISILRTAAQP